jgi:hypothetical protein
MNTMTLDGAITILSNALDYQNVRHDYSTELQHYFLADVPLKDGPTVYEIRIDRTAQDDGFHIQSRAKGSEYWYYVDSVAAG